jgi:hypothetical protein
MTVHERLQALCAQYLRPVIILGDDASGNPIPDFQGGPLSTSEQATYALLLRFARSRIEGITFTEWQALENDLSVLRTFRQQTQAQFIALTQNQRDRALFDVVSAQTNVIRALLRD